MSVWRFFRWFLALLVVAIAVVAASTNVFPWALRLISANFQSNTIVAKRQDMTGKTVVITGANTGIGLETSIILADWGARVILVCRNESKCAEASNRIPRSSYVIMDMSDLESIASGSKRLLHQVDRIDVLINNAATLEKAAHEGAEKSLITTNVIGPYLLTHLLLPALRKSMNPRIVFVTAELHLIASDCTLDWTSTSSNSFMSYARSKLCLNWLTLKLQEKHPDLLVTYTHPGIVDTELVNPPWFQRYFGLLINATQGAQSLLFCAADPSVEKGGYYINYLPGKKFEHPAWSRIVDRARQEQIYNEVCTEISKWVKCE